jgi:polyphosphate kinase 2 (PPK2 family)
VLTDRVEGLISPEKWRRAYRDIVSFERTLANDGYIIVKFFLHISKKRQRKRFKKLEKHPLKSWRVQPEDWERHQKYDKYYQAIEEMLERTHTEWGPWDVIGANNRRWASVAVLETLAHRLEVPLERVGFSPSEDEPGFKAPAVEEQVARVARYETRAQPEPSLT